MRLRTSKLTNNNSLKLIILLMCILLEHPTDENYPEYLPEGIFPDSPTLVIENGANNGLEIDWLLFFLKRL